MQIEKAEVLHKSPNIKLRISEKSDEKILAKMFCESLDAQQTKKAKIIRKITDFNFVRKWILRYFSNKVLDHCDKLLFWLVLVDDEAVGFTMIMWTEGNKRHATIHNIYLLPEFRKKEIERQILEEILKFCNEKNLQLGFNSDPEWELFEEENK